MKVLVINAGSSSLKYQLIDMDTENVIAKGLCERIGLDKSLLTHKANGKSTEILKDMPTHKEAIELVLNTLVDKDLGVISNMNEISAVGHRIVHSGEAFSGPFIATEENLKKCEELFEFAHYQLKLMDRFFDNGLFVGKNDPYVDWFFVDHDLDHIVTAVGVKGNVLKQLLDNGVQAPCTDILAGLVLVFGKP